MPGKKQKSPLDPVRVELFIDFAGTYGRGITQGIMRYVHANPTWSVVRGPRWDYARPYFGLTDRDIDGLIVQSISPEVDAQIKRHGLPVVNISNVYSDAPFPTLLPDDTAIGQTIARFFLERGHRNFGYYGPVDTGYGALRWRAYKQALEQAAVQVTHCDLNLSKLRTWLANCPKPIAIFGANDHWAIEVLEMCHHLHIASPEQVAVMGVDDDELFAWMVSPSLSSVKLPLSQIGWNAAYTLAQLLDGTGEVPDLQLFAPGEIVERQSTDTVALQNPDLVAAVRFIRDHYAEPITVEDVLTQVPLGRRTLERRFRDEVGRSVHEEITRVRIEQAKRMLISSDLAVTKIGLRVGYTTATRFVLMFKKSIGMTPREFRDRYARGTR